jgi:hypothetical protein
MKIVAKTSIEVGVHIYHKGEVCEYDGVIDERIATYFTDENGNPLKADGKAAKAVKDKDQEKEDVIAKTVKVMKREGILQALDGMGITYSSKSKTEYLAKLLLVNRGEIEE